MKEEYKNEQVERDGTLSPNNLGTNTNLKNEPVFYEKDVGPYKCPLITGIENDKKDELKKVSKLDAIDEE